MAIKTCRPFLSQTSLLETGEAYFTKRRDAADRACQNPQMGHLAQRNAGYPQ
jgi:hypothetical protein